MPARLDIGGARVKLAGAPRKGGRTFGIRVEADGAWMDISPRTVTRPSPSPSRTDEAAMQLSVAAAETTPVPLTLGCEGTEFECWVRSQRSPAWWRSRDQRPKMRAIKPVRGSSAWPAQRSDFGTPRIT